MRGARHKPTVKRTSQRGGEGLVPCPAPPGWGGVCVPCCSGLPSLVSNCRFLETLSLVPSPHPTLLISWSPGCVVCSTPPRQHTPKTASARVLRAAGASQAVPSCPPGILKPFPFLPSQRGLESGSQPSTATSLLFSSPFGKGTVFPRLSDWRPPVASAGEERVNAKPTEAPAASPREASLSVST